MIWKVRASPRWARWNGRSDTISRSKKSTLPRCGRSCPPITLNSVVLPAPFGPINTRRSPTATSRVTFLSALHATKTDRDVSHGERIHGSPPRRRLRAARISPTTPAGASEHDDRVQRAQDERPPRRIGADEVAEQNDDEGAEHRPDEGGSSAQDHHQHDFGRNDDARSLGADKPPVVSKEDPGEARKAGRQHKRDIFMKPDIVAERIHPRLAVLHAAQRAAKGRTQNCAHQHERNHECRKREFVEGGGA